MTSPRLGAIAASLVLLLLPACVTSPTGRSQLMLLSDEELASMGEQAFTQLREEKTVSSDGRPNRVVRCVTDAIARTLPAEYGPDRWEVAVFEDETPNAFALPGGKIGVHTGMFDVATTQDQLAAVLGHEIAHVIAGHPNERVSQQLATQGVLDVAGAAAGESSGAVIAVLGAGAQVGILLPFSRAQEEESDVLGLEYMARAGFDPRESVQLWRNMESAADGAPPEFLSTHPAGSTRIDALSARMPAALELRATSPHHPNCT